MISFQSNGMHVRTVLCSMQNPEVRLVDIVCEAYELRRRVREREPPRPGTAADGATDGTGTARVRRRTRTVRRRSGIVHRWLFVLKPVDQYI